MNHLLNALRCRNEALFYFGAICFIGAVLMLCASKIYAITVTGANAWYKPVKFSMSVGIYCWTMGWFTHYLQSPGKVMIFNWAIIILLGYDLLYVSIQAARGQISHFNFSSAVYSALTFGLALAAICATLCTAGIGILFFTGTFPQLTDYYVWGIRLGILLFVVFAFEGGVMGSRLSHTIGGPDGEKGLPFVNWSRKYGDPRIAHFIGMHALQVLPLLSFYVLKDVRLVVAAAVVYGAVAVWVLVQALNGKPLVG